MKIKNLTKTALVALFAVGLTLSSCTNQKKTEPQPEKDKVAVVIEKDGKTKDFTVYTYAEKDKALADANAEIDRINKEIDKMTADLKNKSNELSAEAKAQYEKSIAALEKEILSN